MMKIGLIQEQVLKVTMTQELQQAVTLLQYSSVELLSYLQELTLENPIIEVSENDHSPYQHSLAKSDKQSYIENTCEEKTSLSQYLRKQLIDFQMEKDDRVSLEYLIDTLDGNGYLKDDLDVLAQELMVCEDWLESKLYILQSLDPAGVGARSLQECILLQLRRLPIRSTLAETIISEYFYLFAEKSWKELSKKVDVPINEIQDIQDMIRKLEPRPGLKYEHDHTTYVIPDMIVSKTSDGLEVHYNDWLLPQLIITHPLELTKTDPETKGYYSKKVVQGKWLKRALEQRKETMINVMKVIIQRQRDYFISGKSYLKPLTLKDIAETLEVHESTVSRTIKDKFVQTPQGLVSMKSFFSYRIDDDKGEVSTAVVRIKLKELIDSENKRKPLSDQKIANELKDKYGMIISRRTIAKYREQLNIPTSLIRKQY